MTGVDRKVTEMIIKAQPKPHLMPQPLPDAFINPLVTDHCFELSVDHFIATMSDDTDDWAALLEHMTPETDLLLSQILTEAVIPDTENPFSQSQSLGISDQNPPPTHAFAEPNPSELLNDHDNNLMVGPIEAPKPVLFSAQVSAQDNPPMSFIHTSPYTQSVPSPQPNTSQDSSLLIPQHSPLCQQLGEISIQSPTSQTGTLSPDPFSGQTAATAWQSSSVRARSRSDCMFPELNMRVAAEPPRRPIIAYQRSHTDPIPSTSSQALPQFSAAFQYGLPPIPSSSQSSLGQWPTASTGTSTASLSVMAEPTSHQRQRTTSEPALYHRCNLEHNYSGDQRLLAQHTYSPYSRQGQRRGRPATRTGNRQQTQREKREQIERQLVEQEHHYVQLRHTVSAIISQINHFKLRLETMGVAYPGERPFPWPRQP